MAVAIFLAILFLLLGAGVWIGLSLIGVAWIGMEMFTPRPAGDAMAIAVFGSLSSWTLTALPLFIWMGEILFRSKLSEDMFRALAPWMGRVPGRLLQTNVIGCAIFAAISGSSAATCATIGKMTLPELKKRGYPDGIAIGSLAGSGTLGLLIPPSIIMIVYGVSADVSIARLFIAGVIPGIMLALLFGGYVAWWAWRNPSLVPKDDFADLDFMAKLKQSGGLIPTVLLIVAVLGSIYTGIATATESAAIGVVGALILSTVQGSLTRENFIGALLGATRTTTMIMLILAGSAFLTIAMGFTGLPRDLALWVKAQNFSPLMLIAALTVFFVILGCFLDGISMVVLTMAVLLPMVQAAGFDLVWFGIFIVLVVEMAQITPPVGFNLFVLQGMTGRNIFWITRAALPFFFLMVVAVALVVAFPGLVTWLPSQMLGR
jgi:tripartite ATP-independent transporter DctM subunit